MDYKCPKCGYEHGQSIAVLRSAGRSSGRVSGGGVSFSPGGMGVQSFSANTQQVTDLAHRFDPGPAPSDGGTLIVIAILCALPAVAVLYTTHSIGIISGIFLVVSLLFVAIYISGKGVREKAHTLWSRKVAYYSSAWFCHRCGNDWLPENDGSFDKNSFLRGE